MGSEKAGAARTDYADTWDGGFVRVNAREHRVYVIRRMRDGRGE